jgi:hypothetical protein
MKKIVIAAAALSLMCGSAFAQGSTGPAAQQDNMTKPGMSKDKSMENGSMKNRTTGMNNRGMANDPNAMPNKDATGQGTVGPDSKGGMMKK